MSVETGFESAVKDHELESIRTWAEEHGLVLEFGTPIDANELGPKRAWGLVLTSRELEHDLEMDYRHRMSVWCHSYPWSSTTAPTRHESLSWEEMIEHPRTCRADSPREALLASLDLLESHLNNHATAQDPISIV